MARRDQHLGGNDEGAALPIGSDPADRIIGVVRDSSGDESVNHDHYLYGWPKESG